MSIATFDFTDYNAQGYLVLEPGKYAAKCFNWEWKVKEETGNQVNYIDFVITDGKYVGEQVRHFQTISGNDKSVGAFFGMLTRMGLIKEEDRKGGQKFTASLKFDDNEKGEKRKVLAVTINDGEIERPVENTPVTLTIINEKNDQGETVSKVSRVDAAGLATGTAAPKGKGGF